MLKHADASVLTQHGSWLSSIMSSLVLADSDRDMDLALEGLAQLALRVPHFFASDLSVP